MTSLTKIYNAFLGKMTDDEYALWTRQEAEQDWFNLMLSVLPRFKFPRVSLQLSEDGQNFENDLNNEEIQIIATYMKCEWLDRNILTWENISPLYDERDFSPANQLNNFVKLLAAERKDAKELESIYYRSYNGKPFDFTKLAGS